jgi:TP53 regulating kinase-like protein
MLIKKGAEANLFLEKWHNRKVIIKRRMPKKYRLQELDNAIRFQRTISEPQMIHNAKEAGVPSPTVLLIDTTVASIVMEYVAGKQVKQILDTLPQKKMLAVSRHIGTLIGRLHQHGIIHGDLTTSNMILTPTGKIVFVDFGLSERSIELEAKGVDLHLMQRAFQSTHYKHAEVCFEAVMGGYTEIVGGEKAKKVLERIKEITRRGRYVSKSETASYR